MRGNRAAPPTFNDFPGAMARSLPDPTPSPSREKKSFFGSAFNSASSARPPSPAKEKKSFLSGGLLSPSREKKSFFGSSSSGTKSPPTSTSANRKSPYDSDESPTYFVQLGDYDSHGSKMEGYSGEGGAKPLPAVPTGRRSPISVNSAPERIPKTWEEWNKAYQTGELDFENPPQPPSKLSDSKFAAANGQLRAPLPINEPRRLKAVRALNILPSKRKPILKTVTVETTSAPRTNSIEDKQVLQEKREEEEDKAAVNSALATLANRASKHFGTGLAMISLMDEKDQHIVAEVGLGTNEAEREAMICDHSLLKASTGAKDPFVVRDIREDWRFNAHDFGFYASVPLTVPAPFGDVSESEYPAGVFCILDRKARKDFSTEERAQLSRFAAEANAEIYKHQENRKKKEAARLVAKKKEWKRKAQVVKKVAMKSSLDTVQEATTPPSSPELSDDSDKRPNSIPHRPSLARTMTSESSISSIITTEIAPTFNGIRSRSEGRFAPTARGLPPDVRGMLELSTKLVAESLDLDLCYVLAIDLEMDQDSGVAQGKDVRVLSAHNMPIPAPLFDVNMHAETLLSSHTALLYANPYFTGAEGDYATGVLVKIAEHNSVGYVLGGFAESVNKVLNRQDFVFFRSFAADLVKYVITI